jgi:Xaa-Pro aminopeptidase
MFQGRLAMLRQAMAEAGLDALVLPKADAHHVEWLRPAVNLVARFSGFQGSYGRIIIFQDRYVLVTSGIYLEAAAAALNPLGFEIIDDDRESWVDWLSRQAPHRARIGCDPWLHTMDEFALIERTLASARLELVSVANNPVERILPKQVISPPLFFAHPERFTGLSSAAKRSQVAEGLRERGADACLLSAPDSLCWLLNIRGDQTFDAPLAFGWALVRADASVTLFLGPDGVTADLVDHLDAGVTIVDYDRISAFCEHLAPGALVELDASRTSEAVARIAFSNGRPIINRPDPCQPLKAVKNPIEIAGARTAHLRDGIAQVRFWHWLDARVSKQDLPTEAEAEERIDALRAEQQHFRSVSFRTIAATGPSGSMPHYRSDLTREIRFVPDALFLLDSGGQFLDGTTDVTRTWGVGRPSAEACLHYTLVLKGMIDAHTLRFPRGSRGYMIDAAARRPLWLKGLDYPHGTGHGVGSFLGVHEYPIRLRTKPDPEPLIEGMITSIEPGYYRPGHYGIRHENLVCVTADEQQEGFLKFETLTLCPFDLEPVVEDELGPEQIAWLDSYHDMVWERLRDHLDGGDRDWLHRRTRAFRDQRELTASNVTH